MERMFSLLLIMLKFKNGSADWNQIESGINGKAEGDRSCYLISMSKDGKTVVIGALDNNRKNCWYSGCA